MYYRHDRGQGVILYLYVDDILIFGISLDVIKEVKTFLCKSFDMKDLGEADVILNIRLIRGENEITLTQSRYVENVLSCFGYKDSKPSATPYDPSLIFRKNRSIGRDQLRYSHIIRSLMYLISATRSDISFTVIKLVRFTFNPRNDHWHALERVMHYMVGTMDYIIYYFRYPTILKGYSDASWIFDVDELYTTSGYVFTLGGVAVS